MKKFRLLVAVLALFAVSAQAEYGSKGSWEFGPYVGMLFPDNYGAANLNRGLLVGGRLGYFITSSFSAEGSFQRAFAETVGGSETNLDSSRLNLLWNFLPGRAIRPFITAGAGWERTAFPSGSDHDLGINGGLGVRFFLNPNFNLRLDGRYNTVDISRVGAGRQKNYEGNVGFNWLFGGSKKAPTPVEEPVVQAPKDDDQDGVINDNDKCPNTAAGAVVDATGCVAKVEPKPTDSDLDGVMDDADKCPNTPAGVAVDSTGCPRDSDGDKVSDDADKCPNTKSGTQVDANGCPMVTKSRGVLKGVTFQPSKAILTPNAKKVLDGVAEDLKAFPEVKVEVQGHTDNTGNPDKNTALSQARAEAVSKYLVSKGVDASRLTAKGYGPSMPTADNKTKEGRLQNRRVELKWLD